MQTHWRLKKISSPFRYSIWANRINFNFSLIRRRWYLINLCIINLIAFCFMWSHCCYFILWHSIGCLSDKPLNISIYCEISKFDETYLTNIYKINRVHRVYKFIFLTPLALFIFFYLLVYFCCSFCLFNIFEFFILFILYF